MNDNIIHLELPMSPEDSRNLALGDLVTVSGQVFTGRSRFHIRAITDDIYPPIDYSRINCFFHSGPVMKKGPGGGWEIVSIEPTSSIRFEKYSGRVVEKFGLRTLIGKTTMGPGTAEALKKTGGVHLSKIGICGNQISQQVDTIESVYFLDELGKTEATWVFRVNRFGPFFVDIDSKGNNYFQALDQASRKSLNRIYRDLEIPEDFEYTEVG
jgi:tartrate/fumarate subfamily iron-sulfur-dependent hydro-lyase beta chain